MKKCQLDQKADTRTSTFFAGLNSDSVAAMGGAKLEELQLKKAQPHHRPESIGHCVVLICSD